MNSTLTAQIENSAANENTKANAGSLVRELATMLTMTAVTATSVILLSLTWVN